MNMEKIDEVIKARKVAIQRVNQLGQDIMDKLIQIVKDDRTQYDTVLDKWAGLCDNDPCQILEFGMRMNEEIGGGSHELAIYVEKLL